MLRERYDVSLISGDNASQAGEFVTMFGGEENLRFNQSPHDKLNYVDGLKSAGKRVLMVGDGLNDSGALAAADVGVALTEDIATFSPASDAILSAEHFGELPRYLDLSRRALRIVQISFVISLIYNVVGGYFAVSGQLSPLIAAILMPVSSVSVVGFAVVMTRLVRAPTGAEVMSALIVLIGASLLAAIGFLVMFIWAVRNGQYEDTYTPSVRVLHEDIKPRNNENLNDTKDK